MIEPRLPGAVEFAVAAERIGVESLWVPEVWGYDALTGLAYLAAKTSSIQLGTFVVQLGSRSPALLATSALSLQELSSGRFILGIGTSGPRVMEGWHGVRFRKPVQTTRETIEIIRIVSRGERLEHDGEIYPLPLPDSRGAALRPMVRPDHVPVYVAAMGPQNLRLTGEAADGWLGNAFIPEAAEVFLGPLREGAQRAGRSLDRARPGRPRRRRIPRRRCRPPTPPRAATPTATRSPSAPWVWVGRISTTTPSPDWATGRSRDRRRVVAGRQTRRGPQRGAAGSRPPDESAGHRGARSPSGCSRYRAAGITTLLAKLDGDLEQQLAILERLVAIAESAEPVGITSASSAWGAADAGRHSRSGPWPEKRGIRCTADH